MRKAAWLLSAFAGMAPLAARALPADVLVVVDNSESMLAPAPGGEGTKFDVARDVASRLIDAARDRHRVGLVTFGQIEEVVQGGEGPYTVRLEDPERCARGGELLVGPSARDPDGALAWIDGEESAVNPEIVGGGDSPLLRTTETLFEFIRLRRWADPARACVNAVVVFVTDGEESCVSATEWKNGLRRLGARGVREDVRTLVLSFDPEGEASNLLAGIGREGETRAPYGPDEVDALVDALSALEGRFAPEACVATGIPPEAIGGDGGALPGDGDDAGAESSSDGGCDVSGGGASPGAALLLALALAFGAWRRRRALALASGGSRRALALASGGSRRGLALASGGWRRALLLGLALLAGCGDEGGGTTRVPGDDGGFVPPAEPSEELASARARIDALATAAEAVRREHVAPLLSPEARFAAVEGADGCLALVRGLAFEPYQGAQRGAAGCLASSACNGLDRARLLQACLASKGVEGEVQACTSFDELRTALRARVGVPATAVDVAPALAAVDAALGALDPDLVTKAKTAARRITERGDGQLRDAVRDTVAALRPHLEAVALDAETTAEGATGRVEAGLDEHFVVVAGEQVLDPTLDATPEGCHLQPIDPADYAVSVTVSVEGWWGTPSFNLHHGGWKPLGGLTFDPAATYGEWATVRIEDTFAAASDGVVPPPSTSGCLRASFQVGGEAVVGEPFWIGEADAAGCTGTPIEVAPGRHLAGLRLVLETDVAGEVERTERVLLDRYGFATEYGDAHEAGPMYPDARMRELAAMRIEMPVVAGVPNEAKRLDVWLESLAAGRSVRLHRAAHELGAPVDDPLTWPRPIAPWAVLSLLGREAPALLPEGGVLVAERPWLFPVVSRRAFLPVEGGLRLGLVWILDLAGTPALVAGGEADARLEAQLGLGALLTEAERLAIAGQTDSASVVNAAAMLRDPKTGPWEVWGANGHDEGRYPEPVRDQAWTLRQSGQELVVTPGAVPFEGADYIAWWRLDRATGLAIGDVRYEGTFYAGAASSFPDFILNLLGNYAAPVSFLADVDKCLFAGASAALQGEEYNVVCCLAFSAGKYAINNAFGIYMNGVFGNAGELFGAGGAAGGLSAGAIEKLLELEWNLINSIPLDDPCAASGG